MRASSRRKDDDGDLVEDDADAVADSDDNDGGADNITTATAAEHCLAHGSVLMVSIVKNRYSSKRGPEKRIAAKSGHTYQ